MEEARRLHKIREHLFVSLTKRLVAAGAEVRRLTGGCFLRVNDEFTFRFKIARSFYAAGTCKWILRLRCQSNTDMTSVARMEPGNQAVLDYYVVPKVHHFDPAT